MHVKFRVLRLEGGKEGIHRSARRRTETVRKAERAAGVAPAAPHRDRNYASAPASAALGAPTCSACVRGRAIPATAPTRTTITPAYSAALNPSMKCAGLVTRC